MCNASQKKARKSVMEFRKSEGCLKNRSPAQNLFRAYAMQAKHHPGGHGHYLKKDGIMVW